ncbi:MAG: hypothetical protein D3924_15755 [Candidatus Electrothrix sp. AR4]|nr:hypothetical protein [Candidatus Electrothrix sp. AR4]
MGYKKGKWWDGGFIKYSDDNNLVRIWASMCWVGIAILAVVFGLLLSQEAKELSGLSPWFITVKLGVLLLFFGLGIILTQSSMFCADKSKGTYRLAEKWMGISTRKQSGDLKEIDYVIIKENVLHSSDTGGSFFHIYLQVGDIELYLFQLTDWLNLTESRRLAFFLGCPLKHTDKWPLREGTYEREESLEEIKNNLLKPNPLLNQTAKNSV